MVMGINDASVTVRYLIISMHVENFKPDGDQIKGGDTRMKLTLDLGRQEGTLYFRDPPRVA